MNRVVLFSIIVSGIIIGSGLGIYIWRNKKNTIEDISFVVGLINDYAPWSFIDHDGQLRGFDVDIAKKMAEVMHKHLHLYDKPVQQLWKELDKEDLDIIIAPLDITKKRKEEYNMIYYHGQPVTEYPLIFWKTIPPTIKTIEDLKNASNRSICVQPGTQQEMFLQNFYFLKLVPVNNVLDIMRNLQFGQVAAAMVAPEIDKTIEKQYPDIKILRIPVGPEFQSEGKGMAVKKREQQFAATIQQVVTQLQQEGFFKEMEKKWGLAE
ncbi:MAG TPA: ABC transporter substrate-binding protein [Candidatus Bathyarchaeia archaeon]|nr:ABC transporter substrate-binding protein [Candidatus Bathyarchaeia archaeon]